MPPANKRKAREAKINEANECKTKSQISEKEDFPKSDTKPVTERRSSSTDSSSDDNDSDTETNGAVGGEMTLLLNSFGVDVSKTLDVKRKRLNGFTSATIRTSNNSYAEIFSQQQTQRDKIIEEYGRKVADVFKRWEDDIKVYKDAEDNLQNVMRQVQKNLQQQKAAQNQKVKSLKKMFNELIQKNADLAKSHTNQLCNTRSELRKELSVLQKTVMEESRQEEMLTVRKSLQNMLSQV